MKNCVYLVVFLMAQSSSAFLSYPQLTGPYPVGVKNNIVIGQFLVSIYYPAETTETTEPVAGDIDSWQGLYSIADDPDKLSCAQEHAPYFYYPFAQTAKFLAKFLTYNIKVPVRQNLPVLQNSGKKFPLIIFSHGHASFHAFHLALILDLASQGFIVAAIDHSCKNALGLSEGEIQKEGEEKMLQFRRESSSWTIKVNQRVHEFDQTIKYFTKNASHEKLYQTMNLEDIGIIGQSLGGEAALKAASQSKYKDRIKALISLDSHDPMNNISVNIPTLILMKGNKKERIHTQFPLAKVYTLPGSHTDFSDITAVWNTDSGFHRQYIDIVLEFLKRTTTLNALQSEAGSFSK